MNPCPNPCPAIAAHRRDHSFLREHLLRGHQCVDSWLALSDLVATPEQRKDCLERAAVLVPGDQTIQVAYLQACLDIDPGNVALRQRLNELTIINVLRASGNSFVVKPPRPRQLGEILVDQGFVTQQAINVALNTQRRAGSVQSRRLGQLLLDQRLITPQQLARALVLQQQERSQQRVAPQALGEFLVDKGVISVQDLEQALEEQIRLDMQGRQLLLGELLLHMRLISPQKLQHALKEFEDRFWERF